MNKKIVRAASAAAPVTERVTDTVTDRVTSSPAAVEAPTVPSAVPPAAIVSNGSSGVEAGAGVKDGVRRRRTMREPRAASSPVGVKRFSAFAAEEVGSHRQAELFYLQKQIQLQTQMVLILEDGSRVQGVIEWYDRHSIKVRGKARVLVYKSAIKYLYKAGEVGTAPVA